MVGVIVAAGGLFHQLLQDILRLGNGPDNEIGYLGLIGRESDRVIERADAIHEAQVQRLAGR